MEKKKKRASKLMLPLIPHQPVKLILENGSSAQTYPDTIDCLMYENGVLYVTFTTASSIYQQVPVHIKPLENYLDGQKIEPGAEVSSKDSILSIDRIEQVLEDKIIIRDKNGKVYATPILSA